MNSFLSSLNRPIGKGGGGLDKIIVPVRKLLQFSTLYDVFIFLSFLQIVGIEISSNLL